MRSDGRGRYSRRQVLVIVPPNSNTVIDGQLLTVTRPEEHSDWSDFMSLGTLSLVCALRENPYIQPIYLDGTVVDLGTILDYISEQAHCILAVCIGVLTANYEAGLLILRHAKEADSSIATVVGNDHFTALPDQCMMGADCIDFGFLGNEVVGAFAASMDDLRQGRPAISQSHPALVTRVDGGIRAIPQQPEPVFAHYDYALVDEVFDHTSIYSEQFARRVAARVQEMTGRQVRAGVPVELGRGCVKFATNDACSFCSIQYGGMWKNQLSPADAWRAIELAWRSGYDYLYVTADELPLTFAPLLKAMEREQPPWWRALSTDERPMLVGYARADGIADPKRTRMLLEIGFRQVMIGMDAGASTSLAAMNKPLGSRRRDMLHRAEQLFSDNWRALEVARDHGMLIRAGFVLGHIGLTSSLLEENVEKMIALLDVGRDVISAIDIEILQPTPGSLDWTYLTSPRDALAASKRLGVTVDSSELARVAEIWRDRDVVLPEIAMRDYSAALMPEISFSHLAEARSRVREHAKERGIVVGE